MKVAIVGSRSWRDIRAVKRAVDELPEGTIVISGGARGPDTWAVDRARKRGLEVQVFRALWRLHGKSAGMIRNARIVDECDKVIAFWDGKSKGTAHTISIAEKMGKEVCVCRANS